jgi:hypothetical protein
MAPSFLATSSLTSPLQEPDPRQSAALYTAGCTTLRHSAIEHLHDNKSNETVTENPNKIYSARPGINMYGRKRMFQ